MLTLVLSALPAVILAEPTVQDTVKHVNFELQGQTMTEVAQQISRQLNYRVLMTDKLANIQVFGNFNNITLEEFFARNIFRDKNIAILYDDTEKVVIIRDFGSKQKFIEYRPSSSQDGEPFHLTENDAEIEVTPGVKLKDIVIVEEPSPIDIEVTPGHTLAEIPSLDDSSINPADIEVTPGHTLAELSSVDDSADPADIEVTPGHTLAELPPVDDSTDPASIEVTPGYTIADIKKYEQPHQTQQSDRR